ncbi:MAG TPA: class II aldolase/adducin family protein [Caulobacteraceae bacterium]|jgi:L-fuculose-phosphate aldolase
MSEPATEQGLREDMVRIMRLMETRGLNRGTSGNVSVRMGDGLLVTPSGVTPEALTAASIVFVDAEGNSPAGSFRPSSEWRMHAGLYARRPDFSAVVHCHARHATILACAGKPIPPLHYMVGISGKSSVPLAPYRTFGTLELANVVADAMDGGSACLMANHGLIAASRKLDRALTIAEEMEEQAAVYWGTLCIGGPSLLNDDQMAEVMQQFKGYGQKK